MSVLCDESCAGFSETVLPFCLRQEPVSLAGYGREPVGIGSCLVPRNASQWLAPNGIRREFTLSLRPPARRNEGLRSVRRNAGLQSAKEIRIAHTPRPSRM